MRIGRLDSAQRVLEARLGRVTRFQTDGPKMAGVIVQQCIQRGSDLIVVAGGDGTINEVVDGLKGSAIPLGILPGGTANVLANEIGLGGPLEKAAATLARCTPRRVSLGLLHSGGNSTGQHFLLMAGIGLDAHIVLHLNPVMKARFGKLAYWQGGLAEFLRRLEVFEVQVNGERHSCSFALISKVRNYGGDFEIAQQVRLDDDHFEVVLFEGPNPWRYLIYLTGIAVKQLKRLPGVRVLRASHVSMASKNGDNVHVQVDGEYAGLLPAVATLVPNALTLLAPPEYGLSRPAVPRAG